MLLHPSDYPQKGDLVHLSVAEVRGNTALCLGQSWKKLGAMTTFKFLVLKTMEIRDLNWEPCYERGSRVWVRL